MPLKFRLGNGEKGVLRTSDLLFIQKMLKTMRNPKTRFDSREFVEKGEDYLFNYVGKNVGGVDEGRRNFLKGIVIGIAAASVVGVVPGLRVLVPPVQQASGFPKSLLTDSSGNPVKASSVPVNSPIIMLFEYPLTGEPNFLINLGDKDNNPVAIAPVEVTVPQAGKSYKFPGGVGPKNSIVAYSAICQHLGCTPPYIHFYPPNYVGPSQLTAPEPDTLTAQALLAAKQANVPALIHCDCHGSTYDPYRGAAVLTGPTVRPLPAVLLEWDNSTDYLYAIGAIGVATYPEGADGTPSQDPNSDLNTSQFGSSVGDKTQLQASTNPFSGS